jgi:hypothetical protein
MRYTLKASGIGIAIVFAAFAPSAVAQEVSYTWTCQDVGTSPPEALGDHEGHSISVGTASCHSDSGLMSGAVLTGTTIWEWKGPNANMLSSNGVIRKPGATAVYQNTEGSLTLTITDGKPTGFTASGKGDEKLATGSLAALSGKPYTWTAKTTGPGLFTIEVKQ